MQLRSYQQDALDAVVSEYATGTQRQLIVLPTGAGKTPVFAALPGALNFGRFDMALTVAHVKELIGQATGAFERLGCWVEREQGDRKASQMAQIVCGSVQSLCGKRLEEFFTRFEGRIRVLIIDEAHRSVAKSYRNLIDAFFAARPDGLLLGVTASPRRTDNVGLGSVYDSVTYAMDLEDAITDGYLVPIEAYRIETGVDISSVRTRHGDFDHQQLAAKVDVPDRTRAIVEAFAEKVGTRQAIVFGATVDHAKHMAMALTSAGFPTVPVWGAMPALEREQAIAAFAARRIQGLACQNLLIEGLDVPGIEAVVMARPTKSQVISIQTVGRGMRPHAEIADFLGPGTTAEQRCKLIEDSPKKRLIVLDVADVCSEISLQSVPSIFGLPPKLNLAGKNPGKVKRLYEQACEVNADEAKRATTIAQLQGILRVDLFTVPRVSSEVAAETKLSWIPGDGRWWMALPPTSIAYTNQGEVIEDYDARIRDMVLVNKRAGMADPQGQAFADLDVNLGTVERESVRVDVEEDALGAFIVVQTVGDFHRQIARRKRRAQAFAAAEAWMLRTYPTTRRAMRASPLHNSPISARQRQILASLGTPPDRMPVTYGEAETLIGKIRDHNEKESA